MIKDTIIQVGDKFILEENWEHLVEVDTKEKATPFTNEEATQIIKYLGKGEKVPLNEN